METKICSKCKEEKELNKFPYRIKKNGLLHTDCKECRYTYNKVWRETNFQKNKQRIDEWKKNNRERMLKTQKEYYKTISENKDSEQYKKMLQATKKWYNNNREKARIIHREYTNYKLKSDPQFKLDNYFSRNIRDTLKSVNSSKANRSWENLVGYSAQQLKEHLEKQFKPEMNWDNHGTYWHIDHITPKSWFKYDSAEHPDFKKCWALENLQPLEAKTNILKGNKYEG